MVKESNLDGVQDRQKVERAIGVGIDDYFYCQTNRRHWDIC